MIIYSVKGTYHCYGAILFAKDGTVTFTAYQAKLPLDVIQIKVLDILQISEE